MPDNLRIRAVIPARNAEWCIQACLSGLFAAGFARDEIVVVDDGSTDQTAALSQQTGVRILSNPSSLGAGASRNRGAHNAEDVDILFFVDADVVVHADVRARLLDFFSLHSGIDAVFGAYDDKPSCPALSSQYRNLLHHYVHCQGPERPKSFWTGCGAVRASVFKCLGGFDERQRMMEDIEFGIRLTHSGRAVALYARLQGKHLKTWTVLGMARSDIFDRAIPWTRLMLFGPGLTAELNLDRQHRLSALLTVMMWLGVVGAAFFPMTLGLSALSSAAFIAVNREFLRLVRNCAGRRAALASIPLHILHYTYAVAGFGWVVAVEYLPRQTFRTVMLTFRQQRPAQDGQP